MSEAPGMTLAVLAGAIGFALSGWELALGAAVGAYFITHIGAAFPDIDHHSAIPYRYLKTLVMYAVGGATMLLLWGHIENLMSMFWSNAVATVQRGGVVIGLGQAYLALLLGLGMVVLLIVELTGTILDRAQPKHRGVTHEKNTGLVLSGLITAGVYFALQYVLTQDTALVLGVIMGFANYLGVLSHLRLDGLLD